MYHHRFLYLLAALMLLFLATPFVGQVEDPSSPGLSRIVFYLLFTLTLISALYSVSTHRRTVILGAVLVVLATILRGMHLASGNTSHLMCSQVLAVAVLLLTVTHILAFLFLSKRVTANIICASLCGYLLIGLTWASLYSFIELLAPGSFYFSMLEMDTSEFPPSVSGKSLNSLYFSLVTLTTLGYGDIVPNTAVVRMFAAIEAVVGQIYIAVLVARLVGIQVAQSITRSDDTH